MRWYVSALGIGLLAGSVHAQDLACKGVLERMDQLPKTPHHQFVSMGKSAESKAPISESIATEKAIFVQSDGVWRDTGFTPAEMSKRETQARKHKRSQCSMVREEVLEGAGAVLYSIQTVAAFGTMDSQLWVSKATGLPLLERYVLDSGAERDFYEVRFVYSGIEAPPGL